MSGDGGLVVTGGGWIDTDVDGVDRGADAVRAAAADLAAVAVEAGRLAVDPDLLVAAVFFPGAGAKAELAILDASRALATRAAATGVDGMMLEVAADTYRTTEQAVRGLMEATQLQADLTGTLGLIAVELATGQLSDAAELLQWLAGEHAGLVEPLVAATPALIRAASLTAIATGGAGAVALLAVLGFDPFPADLDDVVRPLAAKLPQGTGRAVPVDPASPEAALAWSERPPAGVGDLLTRLDDLYNFDFYGIQGRPPRHPGQFAIQGVTGADGTTRYVVEIPGTEEWLPGTTNPMDIGTDLDIVGKRPDALTDAVRDAMRQAGVPRGAEVTLVGHSLGGMAAMDLAGDPAFNGGQYRVTHVVTASSPIGGMEPVNGTRVLSLENAADMVVGLDGAPNSGGPDHVTLTYDENNASIWDAHAGSLEWGDRVDAHTDPRVRDFLGGLQPYTDGTARTWYFQARRDF